MARSRRESGFTLFELMLTIVILALVYLGIFSVIRTGVNTQMFVREMSDAGRQGPAILHQIQEDLSNAYFYNINENAFFSGRPVEFGGDTRADQLHLLTTRSSLVVDPDISEDELHHSPLTEVSYMLKEGAEGFLELHRREQPFCDDDPFSGGYIRMISDRVVSLKIQYTGWDLGTGEDDEAGRRRRDGEESARAGATPPPSESDPEGGVEDDPLGLEEEDATLVWEDEWIAKDKGALPVAVKIELVISPDLDPDVMKRMQAAGRDDQLDKSYIHIVLLPQFREDISTMRDTYAWDGSIQEPDQAPGGVAGGRGRGQRGDARQGGPQGQQGQAGGVNQVIGGAGGARGQRGGNQGQQQSGNNPFLDILRGGGGGGGNRSSGGNRGGGGRR